MTHSKLEYEGSCAIDKNLLAAADIAEYEQIEIYNLSNGNRIQTYAIVAAAGSGIISMNGAAAHRAQPDDYVIICSYGRLSREASQTHKPILVYVDNNNQVQRSSHNTPIQAAS